MDEFGLGARKNRPALTIIMYTAYTQRGSLLFMAEKLRFFDETRAPETISQYFGHNFWETNFAVNYSIRSNNVYVPPPDPASDQDINTVFGFGHKEIPAFWLSKKTSIEKSESLLLFPLWIVVILSLIAPTSHLRSTLRMRHRRKAGLCPTCAYDLRMHAPGDKCPECGTLITHVS